MQCSHCGKNEWVTIGAQKYCTHCGNPASGSEPAVAVQPTPPTPAPTQAVRTVSDLRPVNPARSVHSGPASSSPAVLDLRGSGTTPPPPVASVPEPVVETPAPAPEPVVPVAPDPEPAPAPEPTPAPEAPATPPAPQVDSTIAPIASSANPTEARLARAAAVSKSDMIKRFVKPESPAPVTPPEPIVPTAAPVEVASTLPPAIATQLDALKNQVPIGLPAETHKPSPAAVLVATLALAIMGGYIWVSNVSNLTIAAASQKAGIAASKPTYLPSSYTLSGPVSYGPGYLTMQFKSPSNNGPLVITQRKTSWSSASLLELYVAPKTQDYVTVQTQGLTIYLYNGNQATWVNHGIQYSIEGNTHLSKEQVIKIAESL